MVAGKLGTSSEGGEEGAPSGQHKDQKVHVARAGEKVMERIRRRVKKPG